MRKIRACELTPGLRSKAFLPVVVAICIACCQVSQASFIDRRGFVIDAVNQINPGGENSQTSVWRIDQPNIAQIATSYPQIQFLPGDRFKILAGGCDQTGGFGRTWKRYVYPAGADSDVLYHGLIFIGESLPMAPPDPSLSKTLYAIYSRLSDFGVGEGLAGGIPSGTPVEHYIPDPLPDHRDIKKNPIVLDLGFEDNGYSDNGYYSPDPGDGDQCVNGVPAFLIITIGHHGAIPPDPRLYWGIKPADFECQGAWAFVNQGTPDLSYASFQAAFQITWAGEFLNPLNEVLFQAEKGIGSGGNCEGMALLSLVGEDQFVVGDLQESFWDNYRYQYFSQSPATVQFDINVAQWQQLSGYFIHNWLISVESNASTVVSNIERDLTSSTYNFGLLSLRHGDTGHVLVPLAVTHAGSHTYIQVYDPDRPCASIPNAATDPKVDVVGDSWSYDMLGKGVWNGQNGELGLLSNGMGYVPYHGPGDGWTDQITSLAGLAEVIFGSDVSVDQVSDSRGRKLMTDGKVDHSENGLGRFVARIPNYAQASRPKRPRSGDPAEIFKAEHQPAGTPAQLALLARFDREYAQDYVRAGMIYVVTDQSLNDLTFTLSSKVAGKPVRALVSQGDRFLEVKSVGVSATAAIHPKMTVHTFADWASGGVTVTSADSKAMRVTFTAASYDRAARVETLQRSSDMVITTAAKAQVTGGELDLLTAEAPVAATISKMTITPDARTTETPPRRLVPKPIK